jgi:hypothetical protein
VLAGEFGQPPNLQTRVPWRKFLDVQLPLVGQKGSNLIDRSRTTVLDKRAKIDRLYYNDTGVPSGRSGDHAAAGDSRPIPAGALSSASRTCAPREQQLEIAKGPTACGCRPRISRTGCRELREHPTVEVAGIEPASSVALTGLLRAQCVLPLLGPTGHTHKPV